MEKKNPYVMTIGFRRNNADHTRVAEFLNSLGREKAQYIVKAVLAFQLMEERGEVPTDAGAAYNYESIRRIVLQILKEQNARIKHSLKSQSLGKICRLQKSLHRLRRSRRKIIPYRDLMKMLC